MEGRRRNCLLLIKELCKFTTLDKFPPGPVCPCSHCWCELLLDVGSAVPHSQGRRTEPRLLPELDPSCRTPLLPLTPLRAWPAPSPGKTGFSRLGSAPRLCQGCVLVLSQLDIPVEDEMSWRRSRVPLGLRALHWGLCPTPFPS